MSTTQQGLEQQIVVSGPDLANGIECDIGCPLQAIPRVTTRESLPRLITVVALVVIDIAIFAVALLLAFAARTHILPQFVHIFPSSRPLIDWLWWTLGINLLCIAYEGLYTKHLPFWQECKRLVKAATLASLLTLSIVSLGKLNSEISRTVLVLGYSFSMLLLPTGRLLGKRFLAYVGLWSEPVIILGAGETGEIVSRALAREAFLGYRVVGFLDDDPSKQARTIPVNGEPVPVLGGFDESERVIKQMGVRHLIVAAPALPARRTVELVNRLQPRAATVTVVPDLLGVPVMGVEAEYSFDDQILSFSIRNRLANPLNIAAKLIFDFIVGMLLLIAVLPLTAIIALAIKLDSPGPVFFLHRRLGQGGREFNCYKFRTMALNSQKTLDGLLANNPELRKEWERDFKLKNDPRVTRVGRLLRKTSLDELPQIFNVLKHDMSLVGPRPIIRSEIPRFGAFINHYLMVRPGITGLWQVSGRNTIGYPERIRLDTWYIRNWSLWLDITLLIRTVAVVISRRGAY